MTTVSHRIDRPNLRHLRARSLAAHVVHEIGQILERYPGLDELAHEAGLLRAIDTVLMEAFSAEGVEVLTDYMRQEIGLPPRGPDGWTVEEIVALERRRMEVLTQPMAPMIIAMEGPKRL